MLPTAPVLLGVLPSSEGLVCLGPSGATDALRDWLAGLQPEAARFLVRPQQDDTLWVGATRGSTSAAGKPGRLSLCAQVPWSTVARNVAAVPLLCAAFLDAAAAALEDLTATASADPLRTLHGVPGPDLSSAAFGAARHRLTEIQLGARAGDFFQRTLQSRAVPQVAGVVRCVQAHADSSAPPAVLRFPATTWADGLFFLDLLSRALDDPRRFRGALWRPGEVHLDVGLDVLPGAGDAPTATSLHRLEPPQAGAENLQPQVAAALTRDASVRTLFQQLFPGRR